MLVAPIERFTAQDLITKDIEIEVGNSRRATIFQLRNTSDVHGGGIIPRR
jgi:hypothetical protein